MAIRSAVEAISPGVADKLLTDSKENVKNRKVMDSHVDWLAEQMKIGKWRTNGEPIILDEDGRVLDGQHRLYAVMMSGVTIETLVTRGVDRSTFATIDTGAGRKVGDVLTMMDETRGATLAAVLGWLHRYETGKMLWAAKASGFSPQVAQALLKKNVGIRDEMAWAGTIGRSNIYLKRVPLTALAFLRYVFGQHKPNKAHEFFDLLGEIRQDQLGTPTKVLRDWLVKDESTATPAETLEKMAVVVKAWGAFLNDEKPKTYVWRRVGPTPESFPALPGDKESRGKAVRGMKAKDGRKRKKE